MAQDLGPAVQATPRRTIGAVYLTTPAHKSPDEWSAKWFFEDHLYVGASIIPLTPARPAFDAEVEVSFGAIKDRVFSAPGAPDLTGAQLAAHIKAAGYALLAEKNATS